MSNTRQADAASDDGTLSPTVTAVERHPGGHRIARHHHARHQLVYPGSGLVEVTTDAGTWVAPSDRAIWVPAHSWHEHRFFGRTEFHCVAFDPDVNPFPDDGPQVVAVSALVRELVIACSQAVEPLDDAGLRLRAVLVDQLRPCGETALWLRSPVDERLRQACAIVTDDLTQSHSLAQLGRRVAAGERTLSRLFRDDLGLTYPQWRTQVRLHRALILLADDVAVTDVAHLCGWATPSAFIDTYRRTLGHTPGARRGR
ncbi:AraC family transcriptional regulator [Gordonia desulfuricans]|uniref:HTH-type transcriptional regulator RipA n=1 Tax=Gordonia desulfuricans TaxID=89051 RepID=A0A7K3LW15_9ACTN|nr:helix-turn-helix transcriptional regulator [Gordonia desulfuricans]NDK91737.1 AraC family transcriptional regulator [Gordonia desulfuricans]